MKLKRPAALAASGPGFDGMAEIGDGLHTLTVGPDRRRPVPMRRDTTPQKKESRIAPARSASVVINVMSFPRVILNLCVDRIGEELLAPEEPAITEDERMSWIRIVEPDQARDKLAESYRRLGAPPARLDGVVRVHGLRPHTLDAHMSLYRSVLHHHGNRLSRELAEAIGVRVSRINGCGYCVDHHERGLRRLLDDASVASAWLAALRDETFDDVFDQPQIEALRYAERLTRAPAEVSYRRHRAPAHVRLVRRLHPRNQPGRGLLRLRQSNRARSGCAPR